MSNKNGVSEARRSFLGKVAWLITGFIGLVMSAASGLYAIYPALKGREMAAGTANPDLQDGWQNLCNLSEVRENEATKYTLNIVERAGWAETNTQQAVWVLRRGQKIDIFSSVCPHEGCPIDHDQQGFLCRCHSSKWTIEGRKVSGPTPRDLDSLEHRIVQEKLEVKYQNFQRGTDKKIPMA
ncbi:MAG: Rieske (2Fe-2S) protein [Blastocatellia bacterium]|nr:Rieske (2Fe-2S) protein [Blastocatellia bacterium]